MEYAARRAGIIVVNCDCITMTSPAESTPPHEAADPLSALKAAGA